MTPLGPGFFIFFQPEVVTPDSGFKPSIPPSKAREELKEEADLPLVRLPKREILKRNLFKKELKEVRERLIILKALEKEISKKDLKVFEVQKELKLKQTEEEALMIILSLC